MVGRPGLRTLYDAANSRSVMVKPMLTTVVDAGRVLIEMGT